MKLYDYYRSSASFRVRVVCQLKKIDLNLQSIHLVKNGGEQFSQEYQSINQQSRVPTLVDGQFCLTQSLAIIDYLEESFPKPSVYPNEIESRAIAKSIAYLICCDIHPLNNLSTLNYLKNEYKLNQEQITNWYHHWLKQGFDAIESLLQKHHQENMSFCIGSHISIADICLIPQVYNALRYQFDIKIYPLIEKIYLYCKELDPFLKAWPNDE